MLKNKIRISEYFDKLISKIDLAVETRAAKNQLDTSLLTSLNKQRDDFIKEINYVQAYNLRALSDLDSKLGEEISNEELFPKFCFVVEVPESLARNEIHSRLIVTDTFLTEGQILCFEELFCFKMFASSIYAYDLDTGLYFEGIPIQVIKLLKTS
jgi:hypothetical protein